MNTDSNVLGDKGPKCPSCDGYGIVECPQHGHAQRCERCGGTGVDKKADGRRA